MSQAFDQVVHRLDRMSDEEKKLLWELLGRQLRTAPDNGVAKGVVAFGWAQGRIQIRDDFDAPLEEFKDYTE